MSPKSISSFTNNYTYGIVLGGYSSYNKSINQIDLNASGDRLISSIELYKLGIIRKIILSGGNGTLISNGMKESEWSKSFLINMGVKEKEGVERMQKDDLRRSGITIIGADQENSSPFTAVEGIR